MEKWMKMSRLLDFYGGLLTERQREVAQYTYNQDLSLSEISLLTGISRQAVSENLKRADKALEEFEACLGLKERFIFLEEEMAAMANALEAISRNGQAKELAPLIKRLRALSSEEGEML